MTIYWCDILNNYNRTDKLYTQEKLYDYTCIMITVFRWYDSDNNNNTSTHFIFVYILKFLFSTFLLTLLNVI